MTQEQKDLILKELSSRLPYGVKACYYGEGEERETLDEIEGITTDGYVDIGPYSLPIERITPFLIPLSKMTEEQEKEVYEICKSYHIGYESKLIDFYHKNHLDYRGLIPMGLGIDATGLNIY